MDFYKKIYSIKSKNEFLDFLTELQKDKELNPQEWENKELSSYLEGIGSWVEDMDGYFLNMRKEIPQDIDWSFIATMFYVGKIYE